jgi:RHS repeat-associated protein
MDQFDRIADNRWYSTAGGADLDRIQHGYDRAGSRIYRKNTVAEAAGVYLDELYTHDGLDRLARLDRGQLNSTNNDIISGTEDFTQAWGLDATGNWATFDQADTGGSWTLTQSRTSNAVNGITAITGGGWAAPEYDSAGNMVQMPQPANPATANATSFDAWSRMMEVSSGGSLIQRNAYDGENRRVTKVASGTTRHYYYSVDWQSLEERLSSSTSADRQFVWGLRHVDDLLLRDRGADRFYALQDPNSSVTGICDSGGTVIERYAYAAYGQPEFLSPGFAVNGGSAYDWEILFCGYRWDSQSGLLLARWRFLHYRLAWLTRDPIGHPAGTNLYVYVHDKPITFNDPFGLAEAPRPPCPAGFKKVRDPKFNPNASPPNGCGDFTGAIQGIVSFFGNNIDCPKCAANFKPDCEAHDRCYQNCDTTKATCDLQLYKALKATCKNPAAYTCGGQADQKYCRNLAGWYWAAISTGVGAVVWIADQREACICVHDAG